MVEILIVIITSLLFVMVLVTVVESIVRKKQIIGKPSVPLIFFISAKVFPFVILIFLLLRGFKIPVPTIIDFPPYVDYIALFLLITGLILAELTSFKLKADLVFGLSESKEHKLQTTGVYSISRHPFYLAFLIILISSVLFVPNFINIILFIFTWIIHHFIMISEERFLASRYPSEYNRYKNRVKRYITVFKK